MGLGHVIRSLALAEMLKNDFDCTFAIQDPNPYLQREIAKVCNSIITLPVCSTDHPALLEEINLFVSGNEIIVLDGYAFNTSYQKVIKSKGCKLVCIDDIHAYHFVSDVVINHAGGIKKADYSFESYTNCYLGPQYALLRAPFLMNHQGSVSISSLKKLFINMGGADPLNHTSGILRQITKSDFFNEIHVVTGQSYRYEKELEAELDLDSRIIHHSSLDANQVASLMFKCRVAICPPSSVAFEYAAIGGLMFLKQIADNQKDVKSYFIEEQIAYDYELDFVNLIQSDIVNKATLIMEKQKALLDGKSPERLKAIFHKLDRELDISLRKVTEADMKVCYDWANDPDVRKASYNSKDILWEDHVKWFTNKIKAPDSNFYIAEYKSEPIGQIRFDGTNEKVISYLIGSEMRGKGLGHILLDLGVKKVLVEVKDISKIFGYVKKENIASCKAFEKAGFKSATDSQYPDSYKYEIEI